MTQTIVITGATSGIGLALAKEYAARGDRLALVGRSPDKLAATATELRDAGAAGVETLTLDVDDLNGAESLLPDFLKSLGRVDILIANAGINRQTFVGSEKARRYALQTLATNLTGTLHQCDIALEYLLAQGHGHLVGISSIASMTGIPSQAAYCASKAGFARYLEAAAIECAPKGVHVTNIMPGFIVTNIAKGIERYPFAVQADVAAKEMVRGIAKKKRQLTVPAWPWAILRHFMRRMSDKQWKKLL